MWGFLFAVCCAFSLSMTFMLNTEPLRCRQNEVRACVHPCPPEKTCRNRDIQFSCLIKEKCEEKCVCRKGYFRNPLGDCITGKECDLCPGQNEFFSCGQECDNVCSELHTQNRTNCPLINIQCNRKCYCEDGFARDDKNECVPVEQCHYQCNQNEEYTTCKRTCPPETCISLLARFKCVAEEHCKPRCTCKPGFLRISEDTPCIHQEECSKQN